MVDITEIRLHIECQVFTVKKELLCQHSDYFQAMFSGSYIEKEQHDITIDVIDANSMNIILRYMEMGLIDLGEYELPVIGALAVAANFLQITELTKQIEYCLNLQLSLSNWVETMTIAEIASLLKLEQLAAAFGLLSFKTMKPEYIPSVQKLFWYLSHPYIDSNSELDIFRFGFQWIQYHQTGSDALLIILGCLDLKRLTAEDVGVIKSVVLSGGYVYSLAEKVVGCLLSICEAGEVSVPVVTSIKESLCERFTERVYSEVLNLVRESKRRLLEYTPAVPVWMMKDGKQEFIAHSIYKFSAKTGFDKWMEVADKNLWGWNVLSWGASKLVIVGGELSRGTGCFVRDVRVYDTMRNEWTTHGVQLPARRHGGATIVDDSMFLIGGVGGFRVTLDKAIIYDLNQRTFRTIANLPDAIQSPAICNHNGVVYTAGQKNIYKYEEHLQTDVWATEILTEMRTNRMISFKEYIYCAQNYFSPMYRFRPGMDEKLELITNYSHPAAAICKLNDRLLVFTRPMCGSQSNPVLFVEEYRGEPNEKPHVIWADTSSNLTVNDVAGCCTLVVTIPPIHRDVSDYHQKYISRYA